MGVSSSLTKHILVVLIPFTFLFRRVSLEETYFDIMTPGYQPKSFNGYICEYFALPISGYAVEFIPLVSYDRTHHFGIRACASVNRPLGEPWECDIYGDPCQNQKALYTWSRNAPPLRLPDNVGAAIGPDANYGFVMMRVHYGNRFGGNVFDYTGVRIRITSQRPAYIAGMYQGYAARGWKNNIPADTPSFATNQSCMYSLEAPIHIFAMRPHTHVLGQAVSAYKYSKSGKWTKIGKYNPQWPQRFYPLDQPVLISAGDIIATQCVYNSSGVHHMIPIGKGDADAMCVSFLYYYVKSEDESVISRIHNCDRDSQHVFDTYPSEASTRFEPNPELERISGHSEESFTINELSSTSFPNLSITGVVNFVFDKHGNMIVLQWEDKQDGDTKQTMIDTDVLLFVSPDGRVFKRWGKQFFYAPCGLFMDDDGFLWITDVEAHQVFKFNTSWHAMPLLSLGKRLQPGYERDYLCNPTAVVVTKFGKDQLIFIADGCEGNSRIVKYSSIGAIYRGAWSLNYRDHSPGGSLFHHYNMLSLDRNGRRLFAGNTRSSEVQIFSYDGNSIGRMVNVESDGSVAAIMYCRGSERAHVAATMNAQLQSVFSEDTVFLINEAKEGAKRRIYAYDGTSFAVAYSWEPEEPALGRSRTIQVSEDGTHIFVGDLDAKTLRTFHIFLNYTGPIHLNYMATEVRGNAGIDNLDWTFIGLFLVVAILLVCAIVAFCVIRRKSGACFKRNVKSMDKRKSLQPRDYRGYNMLRRSTDEDSGMDESEDDAFDKRLITTA